MGTALALPPDRAARAAISHPEAVRAVHASYVAAGAQALLTHTTALPWAMAHGETHAEPWLNAALACAENLGAEVWIALGPPGPGQAMNESVLTWAALTAREGRARGVWFETFSASDAVVLSAATSAVEALGLEYVVTVLPHANPSITRALLESERGAVGVGLNCGLTLMQAHDAEALATATLGPTQKRVFKPAAVLAGAALSPSQVVALAAHAQADWIGVCCGGTPSHLRALAEAA